MLSWSCDILGLCVMVLAVSVSLHPRLWTCCRLIWETETLIDNRSNQALRSGCLYKPTDRRCLWELCLSGALQMLDLINGSLIDWLIDWSLIFAVWHCAGVCSSSPCLNGGSCVPLNADSYTCRCRDRFIGDNCETDTNPCASRPCLNDGASLLEAI